MFTYYALEDMLSRNKKLQLVVGLLAIGIVAVGFFVFSIVRNNIKDENRAIARYLASQEIREEKLGRESDFREQYENIVRREDLFHGIFMQLDKEVELIESIEDIALEHDVDVEIHVNDGQGSIVQRGDEKKMEAESNETVAFELKTFSSYRDFVQFLYKIENMDPLASLTSVSVTRFAQEQSENLTFGAVETNDGEDTVNLPELQIVEGKVSVVFFYSYKVEDMM